MSAKEFHIRLLEAREIECRVSQINKKATGLSLLLYNVGLALSRCEDVMKDYVGPSGKE